MSGDCLKLSHDTSDSAPQFKLMQCRRAAALVEAEGDVLEIATFRIASDSLGTALHDQNVQKSSSSYPAPLLGPN
jgi:hypothetical protein